MFLFSNEKNSSVSSDMYYHFIFIFFHIKFIKKIMLIIFKYVYLSIMYI